MAETALPVLCYVCEAANTRDAEYCCRCSAPMALAHQALGQTVRPKMVAVLGPSGSGKTVYLGMLLDMLSRQPQRLQIVARGAFSIGLQQATVSALARCEFPAKTGTEPECWSWMHCEIHREDAPAASEPPSLLDKAHRPHRESSRTAASQRTPRGTGHARYGRRGDPRRGRTPANFPYRPLPAAEFGGACCSCSMPRNLRRGERGPDFAAMKILSCLKELEIHGRAGRTSRRPVALVFTKVDQVEGCRENPEEFARTYAVGTWQRCRQEFRDHAFFAASVVGCCTWLVVRGEGRRRAALRVEPHGIIEPFEWLLEKLHPAGRR